ncbi:MAG: pilus assembly protein [Rhodospirillales bacterium]|nr:pilus assembly protein [Rhodospirillales bacterium]
MLWIISHITIYLMALATVAHIGVDVLWSRPWLPFVLIGLWGLLSLHAIKIIRFKLGKHEESGHQTQTRQGRPKWSRLFDLASDCQGVTAVEFALIMPVYLYLMIGILEMSLLFFTTTVVDGEVEDASRKIRTGQAELSGDAFTTFRDELCDSLLNVYDCNDLTFDVKTFESFSTVSIPVLHLNDEGVLVDETDTPYVTTFSPGGSGDISVVRVIYSWSFFTPLIGALMADDNSSNSKLLTSTAVFRNEPFE